ncbi:MAG: hypothetical protein ABIS03_07485 [Gemmatimonadaceae bacterium]
MLPRSLWRPAIFLFAVAQLLLAFSPLLEPQSSGARAHAEEAGTTLHHAHNEAECAACSARSLLATSEPGSSPLPAFAGLAPQLPITVAPWRSSAWSLHSRSRAPPTLIA